MSLLSPTLLAFMEVAKERTVHGAAKKLHITQTAVTQRIRSLESKIAATLFLRSHRGMILTAEGETLLRYCQTVSELEGETLAGISGLDQKLSIKVCISGPTSIMRSRIIPQCLPVMTQFPRLLMQFDITDTDTRLHSLRTGASQFAIIREEQVAPEMACKLLSPERYVLVCCKAWENRKIEEIIKNERIIDYDPSDQMTFNYLKNFNLFSYANHERHFVNRTESLALMIAAGLGYGVLTESFSREYLLEEKLILLNANKVYEEVLALVWYARTEPPDYFKSLINAMT